MSNIREKLAGLEKFKYPLLILLLGVALMLVPSGSKRSSADLPDTDELLCRILSCTQGVGEAQVIVSENGVVVVCRGADDAKVRLDIIKAISAYTGFGSDRITILKMA